MVSPISEAEANLNGHERSGYPRSEVQSENMTGRHGDRFSGNRKTKQRGFNRGNPREGRRGATA